MYFLIRSDTLSIHIICQSASFINPSPGCPRLLSACILSKNRTVENGLPFHSRCFGSALSRIRSPKPASRLFRGALPRIQASPVHRFHLPHDLPRHQASKRFSCTFKSAAPVLCRTPCEVTVRKGSRALSQNYLASSNDSSASIKIVFEFVPSKSIDLQNPLTDTDFLRELGTKTAISFDALVPKWCPGFP